MPVSSTATRMSTKYQGFGIPTVQRRVDYKAYISPYGPSVKPIAHFHGISLGRLATFGTTAGAFAGVAGFAAFFLFAEVPRVRDDIVMKIPFLSDFFTKEIAPEDNPF